MPEQRQILSRYITSFNDDSTDFRLQLGKELTRIKEAVENSLSSPDVATDPEMIAGTQKVLEKLNKYNVSTVTKTEILEILKMQNLVHEYQHDADNS